MAKAEKRRRYPDLELNIRAVRVGELDERGVGELFDAPLGGFHDWREGKSQQG